jgi:tRNA threonylcarbamoyladenosine biosynthesis protein TsaE
MIQWERREPSSLLVRLDSLADCDRWAEAVARALAPVVLSGRPAVIGLTGTLGAGKTQWTKYLTGHCGLGSEQATSPTYVLIHTYPSSPPIVHVDAYRVGDDDEFLELGIEEFFEAPCITVVEWADRFRDLMPNDTLWMHWDPLEGNAEGRCITVDAHDALDEIQRHLAAMHG